MDNEYRELFFTEANELLQNIEKGLLALEQDPTAVSWIQELFRAAHTLKGMAAAMGYTPVAQLTHDMENVLEELRAENRSLPRALADALMACLDQLRRWLAQAEADEPLDEAVLPPLQYQLQQSRRNETPLVEEKKGSERKIAVGAPKVSQSAFLGEWEWTTQERQSLARAEEEGFSLYQLDVELDAQCAFKEVRAFMILRNLHALGEIIKTIPSPEDIEAGRFSRGFRLAVLTRQTAAQLQSAAHSVSEVTKAAVQALRFPEETPAPPLVSREREKSLEETIKPASLEPAASRAVSMVRVSTKRLDKLMALVQELVILKIRFERLAEQEPSGALEEAVTALHFLIGELQEEVSQIRLLPIKSVFDRYSRVVRDLSRQLGKEVRLTTVGDEIELDRTVLDEIGEVLIHLVRNAVDHGLETPEERRRLKKDPVGGLRLEARREKGYVTLVVSDDGRGLDAEKIRRRAVERNLLSKDIAERMSEEELWPLIALPGFSTAESVSGISGRGVGVDAVKAKVESLGGHFRIFSQKGKGTEFHLQFPLTLAIMKVFLVRSAGAVAAIPLSQVVETIAVEEQERLQVQQKEALLLREEILPLVSLRTLLRQPPAQEPFTDALIVEAGGGKAALCVDAVVGQQEIALKPVDPLLRQVRGYAGVTLLGDGSIAFVLDVVALLEEYKRTKPVAAGREE